MQRKAVRRDFRDDLLRRVDAQARHLGESVNRIVMMIEERRHLLIKLAR